MRLAFVSSVSGLLALLVAASPGPAAANSQLVHGFSGLSKAQPLVHKAGGYRHRHRRHRHHRHCGHSYYYAYPPATYTYSYRSYYRTYRGCCSGYPTYYTQPSYDYYYSPHYAQPRYSGGYQQPRYVAPQPHYYPPMK